MINRIENAMDNTLDEDWKKQFVTEAIPIIYTDSEGNEIIAYYICKTTYYETDPTEITGLNVDVLPCVFDPETADNSYACTVNNWNAMLYEKGDRFYLCWTVTPEYTLILKYDPETVTETDIFRMAESVNTEEIEK